MRMVKRLRTLLVINVNNDRRAPTELGSVEFFLLELGASNSANDEANNADEKGKADYASTNSSDDGASLGGTTNSWDVGWGRGGGTTRQ